MSKDLVPLNTLKELEIHYPASNSNNPSNSVWSLNSNGFASSLKALEEEKTILEKELKLKLEQREVASIELDYELKYLNAIRNDFEQVKNLCEIERQNNFNLERQLSTLSNELNTNQNDIIDNEKKIENLKKKFTLELNNFVQLIQNKNVYLRDLSNAILCDKDLNENELLKNIELCKQKVTVMEEQIKYYDSILNNCDNECSILENLNRLKIDYLLNCLKSELKFENNLD